MKILVVAQNVPWSSWDTKINLLKEWYKPIIDLTVDLLHVNFSEVKFDRNVQVDRKWMETNIIPRAKGYDLVYFQMNQFDWKAYPMQAAYLGQIGGVHVIEGGHEEFGDYNFLGHGYPGDLWFNLARHELAHALYFIQDKGHLDRTHEYYETYRIGKLLEDLKTTTMTNKEFEKAVEVIFNHEGGYVNNPKDKGGETNFGISKKAYPKEDIKNMTKDRAAQIYYNDYWLKSSCDKMPYRIALNVFDMSVNAGVKESLKTLQRALGVVADGVVGNKTLAALKANKDIVYSFTAERIKYYSNTSSWNTFKNGWINRTLKTLSME